MASKSREKGFAFERAIARVLSRWVSKDKDDFIFARRSASGGAMRDLDGTSGQAGDISADKVEGYWLINNFCIECKFYKSLAILPWRLLTTKEIEANNIFAKFASQVLKSAKPFGKDAILLIKTNNLPVLMATNSETLKFLIEFTGGTLPYQSCYCHDERFLVIGLDIFLEEFSYEDVKKHYANPRDN